MSFLRNASALSAALVHRSGSFIRFTTIQLPSLPSTDQDCQIMLLDGSMVDGRFHLNPANPYIGGPSLVHWIKTWIGPDQTLEVVVEQVGRGNQLRLRMPGSNASPTTERTAVRRGALKLARLDSTRRRRQYSTWERDPNLRKAVLEVWPHRCQVLNCPSASTVSESLMSAILEVHHLVFVSRQGSDSPSNVCLLCSNLTVRLN